MALGLAVALTASCAQADGQFLGGGPGEGPQAPRSSDDPGEVARRAVDDVSAYWRSTYPDVYGGRWVDLAGVYPYGPHTELPPCGPGDLTYEEIAGNAFYCPQDDIIAWDEVALLPALNQEFGAFTVAIVIAHEFGHAVQARSRAEDRTVDLELQADCFAGSWARRVADGRAEGFDPDDVDLDKTVAGMIAIRDVPGTSPEDPMAHGSGFDRVSAFQDGYQHGVRTCKGYADEATDRVTAEIPFQEGDDVTGGNLPLADNWDGRGSKGLLSLVTADLNEFYDWFFDQLDQAWRPVDDLEIVDPDLDSVSCGDKELSGKDLSYLAVYCEDQNAVVLDGEGLVDGLYSIGDFAVASELARLWAIAAQVQLDVVDQERSELQADCLTGSWAASTFPGASPDVTPTQLQISAGDLDEAIMGFLAYGTDGEDATAFQRTDALRTGVFGELRACEEYGPLV